MATFTITSDSDFDSLSTKAGGDTYTINGAVLTMNSDTRWGKNSTATTGVFGNIDISITLGGSLVVDGTQVWWMAYDAGAGNVPTVGSTITGDTSGATGELIGVWSAINTTPTSSGSAMPTTGFIKLKTKTGTFQDNENLSSGGVIGVVNSSTGGQRGWLEIVGQINKRMVVPRLGDFTVNGDWFELGTTTGSAGQIIQCPNSGGTNTVYSGVQIETGVGTGVYEWYPAINGGTGTSWTTSKISTDERAKFVECMSSGQLRIGSDGTSNIGYTPVSGCKIRIPNVLLASADSASYASNVAPNASTLNSYYLNAGYNGVFDFNKVSTNWIMTAALTYTYSFVDSSYFDYVAFDNAVSTVTFTRSCNGIYIFSTGYCWRIANAPTVAITIDDCNLGGFVYGLYLQEVGDVTLTNNKFYHRNSRQNSSARTVYAPSATSLVATENKILGGAFYIGLCQNVYIDGFTYYDRYVGTTDGVNPQHSIQTYYTNGTIKNIYYDSTYATQVPRNGLIYISAGSTMRIHNIGTLSTPYDANSLMLYGVQFYASTLQTVLERFYITNVITSSVYQTYQADGMYMKNFFSDYSESMNLFTQNSLITGFRGTALLTTRNGITGSHFMDNFDSTTTGAFNIFMHEKTTTEPSASSYTITAGSPKFTSSGYLVMKSASDEIVYETPYYIIGHTAFQNVAPTIGGTSTSNFDFYYDIDVNDGSGFSGSYSALTGANLSAETLDATLGFKLRVKINVNTYVAGSAISYIQLPTSSTTTTQAYTYALSGYDLSFTGLATGTKIAVLTKDTETLVELLTEDGTGTATYTYQYADIGTQLDFAILAAGYKYQKISGYALPDLSAEIPISQSVDYAYSSSASALVSFDGSTKKITMNAGATLLDVVGMYSDYIDWALTSNNLRYNFAFSSAGGETISSSAGTSIPKYSFLINTWRIAPDEADHTLDVTQGIVVVSGGGDPFLDTAGAYTVRINYQQPVQAITVNTSGGGGASAADVWNYSTKTLSSSGNAAIADAVWDEATSDHVTAGTTGKKLKDNLTQNNFLGLK